VPLCTSQSPQHCAFMHFTVAPALCRYALHSRPSTVPLCTSQSAQHCAVMHFTVAPALCRYALHSRPSTVPLCTSSFSYSFRLLQRNNTSNLAVHVIMKRFRVEISAVEMQYVLATYSDCVSVAWVLQRAERMRRTLLSTLYHIFHRLSYNLHNCW